MMMRADGRGLYVHIPLCVKKCAYCDFCSYPSGEADWRDRYIDVLCDEIRSYAERQIAIDTIFFGGGTPSLLTVEELKKIVGAIRESFIVADGAEFTLEANPGAISRESLLGFMACGVNRISLGVQSIHENELKILGRIHSFKDFLNTYTMIRECGIKNVNLDLMYGIPEQTKESFSETLSRIIALSPEHIAVYGLMLEEGTPFFEMRDRLTLPAADVECDMYELACKKLSEAGYGHYEISNYAKSGFESRHNLKYWRVEEYIGVGVAACSFLDGVRFGSPSDIGEYLLGSRRIFVDDVTDITSQLEEFVVIRLRLAEGFSLDEYRTRFREDFLLKNKDTVEMLTKCGYAHITDGRFALTEKGFYVSNSIICELCELV